MFPDISVNSVDGLLGVFGGEQQRYYFTQYPADFHHPVGHFAPSFLGMASLSELLMRLQ
jgi:hypothetical protein